MPIRRADSLVLTIAAVGGVFFFTPAANRTAVHKKTVAIDNESSNLCRLERRRDMSLVERPC